MADTYKSKWTGAEIDDAVGKIANLDTTITDKISNSVSEVTYSDSNLTVTKNGGDSEILALPIGDTDVFVVPLTNEGQTYSYNFAPVKHTFDEVWSAAMTDGKAVFFSTNTGKTCPLIGTYTSSNVRYMDAVSGAQAYTTSNNPSVGHTYLHWSESSDVLTNYSGRMTKATTTTGGLMTAADKIAVDSIDSSTFPKVQRLYYNSSGATSSFTLSSSIPSNSLVLVLARRNTSYVFITESMTDSNLGSIVVNSRPEGTSGAPIYRYCTWSGTTFNVGSGYFGYGVSGSPDGNYCRIVAVYAITPFTT